ncbi:MAG TPA: single-stranded DNA-binding protein [Bacteroidales bacterium]|jgi:single-strand DNA-binding protein|nr:single-stranded DNA-binding protein [Bacteroidales bacterium]MDD4236032.1 single-stranded DNA-binding protein [Bacteroidales bacterium]MDY0159757.1 single-stranded DNA-binding protein [Bacteroidales bacterium]HRW22073.1 single-stranded DNA-binding protein [Bacteroidales bacterium]HXK82186.1 single-stranded DNA-binding protein [Bacteroidales bacterium]
MSVNKVILVGRLGKDPEIKYPQADVALAKFSLATNEVYRNKTGGWTENTEWHNIVCWRNTAKYAENNLRKGLMIYIEGKIQTRKWTDQDGKTNSITEIVAENIIRLERGEQSNTNQGNYNKQTDPQYNPQNDDKPNVAESDFNIGNDEPADDLPF